MKKIDGLFHKGEVYWTPVCEVCGEGKTELRYHKCYGCGTYFAFEFRCEKGHTLPITDTCPNCGYEH
jgi:predicted RNA-binding Zn-ribbon protein involved in translation (DUF1610 family)